MSDAELEAASARIRALMAEDESTAYHEAGHTVVRFAMGMRERGVVSLEGYATFGGPEELRGDRPEDRPRLLGHIYTAKGGPLAQERHTGRYDEIGATNDRAHWELCARELAPDPSEREELLRRAHGEVLEILDLHWPVVETLAKLLLENDSVCTADVPDRDIHTERTQLPETEGGE